MTSQRERGKTFTGERIVMYDSKNNTVYDSAESTGVAMHKDDKPKHRGMCGSPVEPSPVEVAADADAIGTQAGDDK